MTKVEIPQYQEVLWPTIKALRALGGSGSISEIVQEVVQHQRYSEQQQQVLHGDGPETEIGYRIAWARTYLKGMGLATNSARGVWSLTEAGTTVEESAIEPLRAEYIAQTRAKAKKKQGHTEDPDAAEDRLWTETLLDTLMAITPDGFERLAQRLLREADFISVTVTGRSGDGGIDGVGIYRMSLISFPVFFQCKRYRGSVGPGAVRDFRGAMAGRGDKGLLITTGTFTAEAQKEATRDGAPPIDLVDGQQLCELLKTYRLGVQVEIREEEDVVVDSEFLQAL